MYFIESTLSDLYQSAVDAFPHTVMRQFAVDPISITNLKIVPFIGLKTLFLKSESVNEDRKYNSIVVLKNIKYRESKFPGSIEIHASDGDRVWLDRPSLEENDVLVRCNCNDFYWRFNYFDHLDKSLYGVKRKKYEAKHNAGSANPMRLPGMCKHLMKFATVLKNSGYISD